MDSQFITVLLFINNFHVLQYDYFNFILTFQENKFILLSSYNHMSSH